MNEIELEFHFDPADKELDKFPLLPFNVPEGVMGLQIKYAVSDAIAANRAGWDEGNIIDIGLFDPRGADFPGGRGFRGWSGTSGTEFHIGPAKASPGYLAGPIQPGTWHILLGLYQLLPQGADVKIIVRLEQGDKETAEHLLPLPVDESPRASGQRWFRGDLHCHSHHSDGSAPLDDLVRAARAQGLDFLAVTEHNTVSHLPHLDSLSSSELLLIPGMEISTYHGHANVWPLSDWMEFRCWTDGQMRNVRELARERGALFSINHPKDSGPPWRFSEMFEPDCIEVWGAPWFISNYQSLAVWDALLRQGRRVTAVGGSDKHQGPFTGELGWYELGTPTTWVWAEALSIPAIVEGLRRGNVFVSAGPDGPRVELTAKVGGQRAMMGDELSVSAGQKVRLTCRVEGGEGCILRLVSARQVLEAVIDDGAFVGEWDVEALGALYFRPEVIEPPEAPLEEEPAALMAQALGNPIYLVEV